MPQYIYTHTHTHTYIKPNEHWTVKRNLQFIYLYSIL